MREFLATSIDIVVKAIAFLQACRIMYIWYRRGLHQRIYMRIRQLIMRLINRLKQRH